MRQNFTHWQVLADFLELSEEQRSVILQQPPFPLNLPLRLAQKIAKGTLGDPILRQFLATKEEIVESRGFCSDPVGDGPSARASKLLHKYQGRALLLCTSSCAMHCRYCFRQNFPYETEQKGFDHELALIEQDTSLKEIILSGGDPLSLGNQALGDLLRRLNSISHLKHIRFHTRFPIGIPERIDQGFLEILSDLSKRIWVILHINHYRELDEDILLAVKKLQKAGAIVMNQHVLLNDVNDSVEVLYTLYQTLIDHGIIPYYLHQLDRVQGAAHFEVSPKRGLELIAELQKLLPGYAVPKYVQEIAGEQHKTSVGCGENVEKEVSNTT
jgi:EF-P beta-lysylation protein EpmB